MQPVQLGLLLDRIVALPCRALGTFQLSRPASNMLQIKSLSARIICEIKITLELKQRHRVGQVLHAKEEELRIFY